MQPRGPSPSRPPQWPASRMFSSRASLATPVLPRALARRHRSRPLSIGLGEPDHLDLGADPLRDSPDRKRPLVRGQHLHQCLAVAELHVYGVAEAAGMRPPADHELRPPPPDTQVTRLARTARTRRAVRADDEVHAR